MPTLDLLQLRKSGRREYFAAASREAIDQAVLELLTRAESAGSFECRGAFRELSSWGTQRIDAARGPQTELVTSDCAAYSWDEGPKRYFTIERFETHSIAVRITAVITDDKILIVRYVVEDKSIADAFARQLILELLLVSFFVDAYRSQVTQTRYINEGSGQETLREYGAS